MELKYLHVNNRLGFQGLNFWQTENNRQLTSASARISVIISSKSWGLQAKVGAKVLYVSDLCSVSVWTLWQSAESKY